MFEATRATTGDWLHRDDGSIPAARAWHGAHPSGPRVGGAGLLPMSDLVPQSGAVPMLARLYWYTVEFGLIDTAAGLRAYGAGILSSLGETHYSIESPVPHRLRFDLERILRTKYLIDEFQCTYFVIDSFEQLFQACYQIDFAPLYRKLGGLPAIDPGVVLPEDRVVDAASGSPACG